VLVTYLLVRFLEFGVYNYLVLRLYPMTVHAHVYFVIGMGERCEVLRSVCLYVCMSVCLSVCSLACLKKQMIKLQRGSVTATQPCYVYGQT